MRRKWSGSSPRSEFFQRTVVSNTSPAISLCKAGLWHLVALFPKVLTTTAVAAELRAKDVGGSAGIETVLSTIEILPAPPRDPMLARYMERCRTVAWEMQVSLVEHFSHWADAQKAGQKLQDWTTDGCHPNPAGHAEMARTILKQLSPLVRPAAVTAPR